jgi:hypothetical protein
MLTVKTHLARLPHRARAARPLSPFLAIAIASGVAACATEPKPSPPSATVQPESRLDAPSVPERLRPSVGEVVAARAAAQGVQIYECKASAGDAYAWTLVGPDAVLTDEAGRELGRHYAGPTWEGADGSKVVGVLKEKADAPDGKGVPWLLLSAKSTTGAGTFAKVTSIQRVDTVGGKAPAQGCDVKSVGATERVPYRATYYFYAGKS